MKREEFDRLNDLVCGKLDADESADAQKSADDSQRLSRAVDKLSGLRDVVQAAAPVPEGEELGLADKVMSRLMVPFDSASTDGSSSNQVKATPLFNRMIKMMTVACAVLVFFALNYASVLEAIDNHYNKEISKSDLATVSHCLLYTSPSPRDPL